MARSLEDLQVLITNFSAKCASSPDTSAIQPYLTELQQINAKFQEEVRKMAENEKMWEKEKEEKVTLWKGEAEDFAEGKRQWNAELEQRMKNVEENEKRWLTDQEQRDKEMREKWEVEYKQREDDLRQRETIQREKEEKWEKLQKTMEENATKCESIVHLNVGGKRYSLAKDLLLKHKGTYFEAILTTSHEQKLLNGEIFIDRDRKLFQYIVDYLKNGVVILPENLIQQAAIESEFAFFHIPLPALSSLFAPRISEGVLSYEYQQIINSWLPNKTFRLRYKASVDGFGAADFHRHCDNRAPTLTIIRTNQGYIFGGYSTVAWSSARGFYNFPGCFIFTLKNPHSITPTRYLPNKESTRSIWCSASDCMSFGNGDVHVTSDSNLADTSDIQFPYSYVDTTGKGNTTFTNGRYFRTDELEVYSVHDTIQQCDPRSQPLPPAPLFKPFSTSSSFSLLRSLPSPFILMFFFCFFHPFSSQKI